MNLEEARKIWNYSLSDEELREWMDMTKFREIDKLNDTEDEGETIDLKKELESIQNYVPDTQVDSLRKDSRIADLKAKIASLDKTASKPS